jgi:hypothetical protein
MLSACLHSACVAVVAGSGRGGTQTDVGARACVDLHRLGALAVQRAYRMACQKFPAQLLLLAAGPMQPHSVHTLHVCCQVLACGWLGWIGCMRSGCRRCQMCLLCQLTVTEGTGCVHSGVTDSLHAGCLEPG